jgi:hypothetical protein
MEGPEQGKKPLLIHMNHQGNISPSCLPLESSSSQLALEIQTLVQQEIPHVHACSLTLPEHNLEALMDGTQATLD